MVFLETPRSLDSENLRTGISPAEVSSMLSEKALINASKILFLGAPTGDRWGKAGGDKWTRFRTDLGPSESLYFCISRDTKHIKGAESIASHRPKATFCHLITISYAMYGTVFICFQIEMLVFCQAKNTETM